jgi:hypothetical protein
MRRLVVILALALAAPVWAAPAMADDVPASNGPFRAKLVDNAALARRASAKLAQIAHQPAPKKLSKADQRAYAQQTKWLEGSAARLASMHAKMEAILAKGERAGITEVATTNMEFVNVRDEIEAEGKRISTTAARPRLAAAITVVRADK